MSHSKSHLPEGMGKVEAILRLVNAAARAKGVAPVEAGTVEAMLDLSNWVDVVNGLVIKVHVVDMFEGNHFAFNHYDREYGPGAGLRAIGDGAVAEAAEWHSIRLEQDSDLPTCAAPCPMIGRVVGGGAGIPRHPIGVPTCDPPADWLARMRNT